MAIINSMGVGRAKKSMGNVTYRTVRGRTIGSQKRSSGVTGATTRGQSGNIRKPLLSMISMFMAAHSSDIQVSFNKSKYGSQRNYFFRVNYKGLSAALNTLAINASASGSLPFLSEVEAAITAYATANPTNIYRVKLDGFETLFMSSAWSPDDNPISGGSQDALGTGTATTQLGGASVNAPCALSMSFSAGARIVHDAANVRILASAIPSGVVASDIQYYSAQGTQIPDIAVSNVASKAGEVSYTTPALTTAMNAASVRIKNVFVRLTSAYVSNKPGEGEEDDPLG